MNHSASIRTAAFSPDGQFLATGSEDRTARIWHVPTGDPVGPALLHDQSISQVIFSPNGALLATVTESSARIWDVSDCLLPDDDVFLAEMAETAAGIRAADTGAFEIIQDLPERIGRLREASARLSQDSFVRWFFTSGPWRRLSPALPLTLKDYLSSPRSREFDHERERDLSKRVLGYQPSR
jgi:hypothetical protein